MLRSLGNLARRGRRTLALGVFVLVAGWTVAAQTLPELVLYYDRARLNIFQFESRLDLVPLDVETAEGMVLRSYYYAPERDKPLIVYFPDRMGDIIYKPSHLVELTEDGYGLLLVGYRGYGGNPGDPAEDLLYADAMALLHRVKSGGLAPDGVVVYGYSMGTGIASYVAAQASPLGLILEAPFTNFADAVRQQFQQVPDWLIRTGFDTGSRMARIEAPILLLAGTKDHITPAVFARELAAKNAPKASLVLLEGGNHFNLIRHGGAQAVTRFMERLTGRDKKDLRVTTMPLVIPQRAQERSL